MPRYYHVCREKLQDGEPLLPRDTLVKCGIDVPWKWPDAPEGFDGDVVCLFDNLEDAKFFRQEHGGYIYAVDVPCDDLTADYDYGFHENPWGAGVSGYFEPKPLVNDEGYLCFEGGIPAEWLTLIEEVS